MLDISEVNDKQLRYEIVYRVIDTQPKQRVEQIARECMEQQFFVSANNDLLNGFLTLNISDKTASVANVGVISWAADMDCEQQLLGEAREWCAKRGIIIK